MKVNVYNRPMPYIYVEDVFTDSQLDLVWTEMNLFHEKGYFEENLGSAHRNNVLLKRNSGFFLNEKVPNPFRSAIAKPIAEHLSSGALFPQESNFFRDFECVLHTFMISYYQDGDFYQPHYDYALGTFLVWLYDEPKKFEGGDFSFPDYPEVEVPSKHNCGIFFPGRYLHQVTPVSLPGNRTGDGRYTLSLFFDYPPERTGVRR